MNGQLSVEIGLYRMKSPVITIEYLEAAKKFIDLCIEEVQKEKTNVTEPIAEVKQ